MAATGLDEKTAQKSGYEPVSLLMWGVSRGISLDGRKNRLGIKLIADKTSGILLGAQTIGNSGAVDRINTLSACLWKGMTLDEIEYLDLAYSPPLGSAWDIIHRAARTLQKKL